MHMCTSIVFGFTFVLASLSFANLKESGFEGIEVFPHHSDTFERRLQSVPPTDAFQAFAPESSEIRIGEICHALITLHLSTFIERMITVLRERAHEINETVYQGLFKQILNNAGMNATASSRGACTLSAEAEKTRYVFEFKINGSAEDALLALERRKSEFNPDDGRDILCMGINYRYRDEEHEFGHDRLICEWKANLYFANGSVKERFPRKELAYSMPVDVKEDSVHQHYDILEEIGRGESGVVHKCREKRSGSIFAAKIVYMSRNDDRRVDIYREIVIMNDLHHRNILRLLDVFEDEEKLVLILEYLTGEQLVEWGSTSEAQAIRWVRQICDAVKHMHERNIFHFNLSPENIMCRTPRCVQVKIIDFGLAVKFDIYVMKRLNSSVPSLERYFFAEFGFHTDMWAVGVITCLLLVESCPYTEDNDNAVGMTPDNRKYHLDFNNPCFLNISDLGIDFMKRLLVKEHKQRMTASESINHPWLANVGR